HSLWAVPLAVLLARAVRRLASRLVRPQARLVAGLAAVLARAPDPSFPRAVPRHLLLLPRRLLQSVLGRSAGLHGRRAADGLPGRGVVPAHPAERPPLFPVHRPGLPAGAFVRRVEGALVHRPRDRAYHVRDRGGHPGAGGQRGPAGWLYPRVPFDAARDRRLPRPSLRATGSAPALRL